MVGGGRTPGQRGVMAVLSAFFAFVMLIFFVVLAELYFVVETKARLTNTADAYATALGNKFTVAPLLPYFLADTINFSALYRANGLQTASVTSILGPFGRQSISDPAVSDAWFPEFFSVAITSPQLPSGIDALVPSVVQKALGGPLTMLSSSRTSQVNLGNPTFIPERCDLLLDISASMRLPYSGNSPPSALSIERQIAQRLLQIYGDRQVDFGVRMFSDGTSAAEKNITPLGGNFNSTTSRTNQMNNLNNTIATFPGQPNNTDFADSIDRAVSDINTAKAASDPLFGAGRIILISDGEPDAGSGISPSAALADRIAAADTLSLNAMESAWNQGVVSDVLFMQHLADADSAKPFMQSIAGGMSNGSAKSNINNFLADGGDVTALTNFVDSLPIMPYCRFGSFDNLSPRVPSYLMPHTNSEPLYAYFSVNSQAAEVEVPRANIFIDDAKGFQSWTQMQNATINPVSGNVDGTQLTNPAHLGMYYSSSTHTVYVSSWMCAAMNSPANDGRNMRLRVRWGAPHLVDSTNPTLYWF